MRRPLAILATLALAGGLSARHPAPAGARRTAHRYRGISRLVDVQVVPPGDHEYVEVATFKTRTDGTYRHSQKFPGPNAYWLACAGTNATAGVSSKPDYIAAPRAATRRGRAACAPSPAPPGDRRDSRRTRFSNVSRGGLEMRSSHVVGRKQGRDGPGRGEA